MTLRLRLVLALVVLAAAGLAVFGFATYGLYARSQYDRLDDELRDSVPVVSRDLAEAAGLVPEPPFDEEGGDDRGPGPRLPLGTYAEVRDADGSVLQRLPESATGEDRPDLPDDLHDTGHEMLKTGSVEGGTEWRVLATGDPTLRGYTVVVAAPTTGVRSSLDRLVLIEASAGAALLALLAAGSWLVLRRGLRPLERMATVAGAITAGDLTAAAGGSPTRVSPADGRSEVGQLGLAINTMLDGLEVAFRRREDSEARLRQFLADASHELRTPLTSIQGFAELFRLGEDGPPGPGDQPPDQRPDQATMMRRIEEEAARMRRLVDDLLLLARLDETRPAAREPVDLAVLAADACSDAVAADPGRPVTLDAPEPVVVRGDENHLRQAIGNLVANALRHTPPGTPVEVGARIAEGRATVTVRDHGPGLDDEALAHAFDRFWRSDAARAGSGAGLGLSIVAGIAAEHGGSAEVANEPDGGGARFTLDLPIDAPTDQFAGPR